MSARRAIVLTMLAGTAMVAAPAWGRFPPRLIWNASASAPIGLYRVEQIARLDVADLVVVMPPEPMAAFLSERGYLPRGVPLIKRVLALAGAEVCRCGAEIVAYDVTYGHARERDSRGRKLPDWQGCGVVSEGEAFLMNWDAADSFDSRYVGPLPIASIVGRAVPVWVAVNADSVTATPTTPHSTSPKSHVHANERNAP
ncbi:MAG: S26 family signal peptidase [Rhizobiaceae bacterium]|nr:S26 family signal peptidase [Rhizobiaceae bacterium]